MKNLAGYAVVDLETTGIFPGGSDRIVEIAIVRMDSHGQIVDKYTSLVNPQRDIGATYIHGVTAGNVLEAPTMADITGDVISMLRGAAFVAHNASFDRRFLHMEMARHGHLLPEFPCLCTMKLARHVDGNIPGRKLEVVCGYLGIALSQTHEAMSDCAATVELFKTCVGVLGGWSSSDLLKHCIRPYGATAERWPDLSPSGKSYFRKEAARDLERRDTYISRLVAKLPPDGDSDSVFDEYLALLDRVLEDRRVVAEEFQDLERLAQECGMSREQAGTAHQEYMRNLMLVALADGVITSSEEADLQEVRRLVDISPEVFDTLIQETRERFESGLRAGPSTPTENFRGNSVCFTGEMKCVVNGERATRQVAQQAATDVGMVVQKGVTESLDFLVVADPDTMSGKAKKARQHGARIIAEPVFWNMVGVDVE